jgi:NTP-dependent ternary system trypsin peptidase co-occuring protein
LNGHGDAIVRADLGQGRVIQVEARTPALSPEADVGLLDTIKKRENLPFDGVTGSIEAIAERVTAALANVKPDKATVEFGIDVALETGGLTGLLAKGSGSAALKITLEWVPEPAADGDDG